MPDNAKTADMLVDTSVAIALLVVDHEHHSATFDALEGLELGLSGHAAFETFSVLTRLPLPARRTAAAAQKLLDANFPHTRFLSQQAATGLLTEFARGNIAGGSVYDALVGAAAREHGIPLATWDGRALEIYRSLGVDVESLA